MVDRVTKEIRSHIMSKIHSKWTTSEKKIHNHLKGNKIRHVMHPRLPGNPDVYLKDLNIVIFIDGCFWHNCPIHGHIPKSNTDYWKKKITGNVERDKKNTKILEEAGFLVIRIWEHEVMSKDFKIGNILEKYQHKL